MDKKSVTTLTLKQINKHTVYQYIYRQRETSKFQIVQDLNMGLSTVSQNLTTLEKEGLIERNGYFASTGGRKAQIIRIVPDLRIAIGIGILKTMFHLVAVDLYGEAVARETIPLAYEDTPEYYDTFAGEVLHFIEKNEYPTEKISGISIATQGIISPDGSSVTYGAIMGNTRMQLSDFASRLPFPCHLVHDSKAAARSGTLESSETGQRSCLLIKSKSRRCSNHQSQRSSGFFHAQRFSGTHLCGTGWSSLLLRKSWLPGNLLFRQCTGTAQRTFSKRIFP